MVNAVTTAATYADRATPETRAERSIPEPPSRAATRDSVELSEAAQRQVREGAYRPELVEQIRAEIASGEYLTDEKLNIAADRLLGELRSAK